METLLRHISITDLSNILKRHADRSPVPHLLDAAAVRRARRLAKKSGVWLSIEKEINPHADIPVLKRSVMRGFKRQGLRRPSELEQRARLKAVTTAYLAAWLGHPKADIDHLQDLVWACCDDWTWVMAAHEGRSVDLWAVKLAATLTEVVHVLGERLEVEVRERVGREVERRIFENVFDYKQALGWKTLRMNWNHVCNGEIVRTALYHFRNPDILANIIHPLVQNMTFGLDGFAEDGGCWEGPTYWEYGFGRYLWAAHALFERTGGEINIMAGEKLERICRYPLAIHIQGGLYATFADSVHKYMSPVTALLINRFYRMPELYSLCERNSDGTLKVGDVHSLALCGNVRPNVPDNRDYVLSQLGIVKLKSAPGPKRVTLIAQAGANDTPHNHNDIGSFLVHKGGRVFLTDPGAPVYTRRTFSSDRYQISQCNALGHSIPVVNRQIQVEGGQYRGTLAVYGINERGVKRAVVDMSRAYPGAAGIRKLLRTFTLDTQRHVVSMEDEYVFSRKPMALEEAFITAERVSVAAGATSVHIGPKRGGVVLTADTPGTFAVRPLPIDPEDGPRYGEKFVRITFKPRKLQVRMSLKFSIR